MKNATSLGIFALVACFGCGDADFDGKSGKKLVSSSAATGETSDCDERCDGGDGSGGDGGGVHRGGGDDAGEGELDIETKGGEQVSVPDSDPCNTDEGLGGIRLEYDGKLLQVHGTAGNDIIAVSAPPSGKTGAILLSANGTQKELYCPGAMAIFGYAGDDNITLSPVAGVSSIAVDGGE